MSTIVKTADPNVTAEFTRVTTADGAWVEVSCGRILVRPDNLMAAVAAECDAIVIPRTDLPEVEVNPTYIAEREAARTGDRPYASIALPTEKSAEDFRRLGIGFIALAEHLDAHPSLDPAQVEYLTEALTQAQRPVRRGAVGVLASEVARRLLATGRIEVRP